MNVYRCFVGALFFGALTPAFAFYEWQGDATMELRGLYRIISGAGLNPNSDLYTKKSFAGVGVVGRIMVNLNLGEGFSMEGNTLLTHIPNSLSGQGSADLPLFNLDRSKNLRWNIQNSTTVAEIDRLNLRWTHKRMDLIIGRQAINLASTFYFTPNDFFATFSAQTFFRVYKPGVDAVRVEYRIGDLTQLSLMEVLGYDVVTRHSEVSRNSYIGRLSTVIKEYELIFIGGRRADRYVLGGAFSGEFFNWLGVRFEGHYALPEAANENNFTELTFGFEHLFDNNLTIQSEIFFHGRGFKSIDYYNACFSDSSCDVNTDGYLGKIYTAIGGSYTISNLLTGSGFFLRNWSDHSNMFGVNLVYSVSNEAEMTLGLVLPVGQEPEKNSIKSEFGLVPYSTTIEIRRYF